MVDMRGRVLIVAGSDSGGGAGIQADIKAVTALGGFAMTAITALTAQNTLGVHGVHPVPPDFLRQQMQVVLDDLGADAIKIGMLHDVPVITTVAEMLTTKAAGIPVVLDPVMAAKGGAPLLKPDAIDDLKARLLPLAAIATPNLPEAELLLGRALPTLDDRRRGAADILGMGAKAVLLKGGHAEGDVVIDVLATPSGIQEFSAPRIDTPHTHGTGCTLASAIACGLAQGLGLVAAVTRARAYVLAAIASAPGFGHGHGPLNHAVTVSRFE